MDYERNRDDYPYVRDMVILVVNVRTGVTKECYSSEYPAPVRISSSFFAFSPSTTFKSLNAVWHHFRPSWILFFYQPNKVCSFSFPLNNTWRLSALSPCLCVIIKNIYITLRVFFIFYWVILIYIFFLIWLLFFSFRAKDEYQLEAKTALNPPI